MDVPTFEWDDVKDRSKQVKHGVPFDLAQRAFLDPHRVFVPDLGHGGGEQRYFCFAWVDDAVMTVRFTWRAHRIRIIGAGYWRKGRKVYAQENN